jgi:hypothetical protein
LYISGVYIPNFESGRKLDITQIISNSIFLRYLRPKLLRLCKNAILEHCVTVNLLFFGNRFVVFTQSLLFGTEVAFEIPFPIQLSILLKGHHFGGIFQNPAAVGDTPM